MPLSPDDRIILDEEEEVAETSAKKIEIDWEAHYLKEILTGQSDITVVHECEGCDAPLGLPILLVSPTGDDGETRESIAQLWCDDCRN